MEWIQNDLADNAEMKECIEFFDGRMCPKNESKIYAIVQKIVYVSIGVLFLGSFVFKGFLLKGESTTIWICLLIAVGYLLKNGGHERVECLSQLQFYDEFLIFYVPKHHIGRGKDQMEIQKIFYKDVTLCEFRTNTRKMVFYGMLEEIHYKYDKEGKLVTKAVYHKKYDGIIKFYAVFDLKQDFKELIENNSPLKVSYKNM